MKKARMRVPLASACGVIVLLLTSSVANPDEGTGQEALVYNSIPAPLPPNISSEGPEAYAFSELGDGVALAGGEGRTLDKVTIVMSSWACTSGNWFDANCVTSAGATYTMPITLNIYSVITGSSLEGQSPAASVGTLLATVTQNFSLPSQIVVGVQYDTKVMVGTRSAIRRRAVRRLRGASTIRSTLVRIAMVAFTGRSTRCRRDFC